LPALNVYLGYDPARDTPVDILHTYLLGIVKYMWHSITSNWTEAQRNLFVIRQQSSNMDGLAGPPMRAAYMMQYKDGLIGKHLKTICQTMIFSLYDGLVSKAELLMVRSIGELGGILWLGKIDEPAVVS
jgi:hypothetical protein